MKISLAQFTRAFLESSLCGDFSQVRIHKDSKAAEFVCSINERALTVGTVWVSEKDNIGLTPAVGDSCWRID